MKVTERSWPADAGRTIYEPAITRKNGKDTKKAASPAKDPDMDRLSESLKALSKPASKDSENKFKMKSSKPDDSVGQLASMLARAETRIDVQQVASRAIRALTNLKMAALASEGSDAKKIAKMIKRMEKLIKRIQKKLQHLSKEEQLENQKKKAERNMEEQRAKEIKEELASRRKKRRKDERNYANKELAEDAKTSSEELVSGLSGALSAASSSAVSVPDLSGFSVDAGIPDSVSIDISV